MECAWTVDATIRHVLAVEGIGICDSERGTALGGGCVSSACGVRLPRSCAQQGVADARAKLVGAVRRGAAAGMSQREIARAVNRSQSEVARLPRFAPGSERGSALAKRRRNAIELAAVLGERVDLVPDVGLHPHWRDDIPAEAVPV